MFSTQYESNHRRGNETATVSWETKKAFLLQLPFKSKLGLHKPVPVTWKFCLNTQFTDHQYQVSRTYQFDFSEGHQNGNIGACQKLQLYRAPHHNSDQ